MVVQVLSFISDHILALFMIAAFLFVFTRGLGRTKQNSEGVEKMALAVKKAT